MRLLAATLRRRVEVRGRSAPGLARLGARAVRLFAFAPRRVEMATLRALFPLPGGLRQH